MGIQMLGNEAIEQINKIESKQNQIQNQKQNQNQYIDISYSEGPLNDINNNIENDLNDIDIDYPFDSN
jgi:hypothetical protein